MSRISFEVPAATWQEALDVAAELGMSLEEIARMAFEDYLDGAGFSATAISMNRNATLNSHRT